MRRGVLIALLASTAMSAAAASADAPGLAVHVPAAPPIGGSPVLSFKPAGRLPAGGYYYAVVALSDYPGYSQASPPACAVSSDMGRTVYGFPRRGRAVTLPLLQATSAQGSWCPGGTYEGAVYAVPHAPPCSGYATCYGRTTELSPCWEEGEHRVCGVVAKPPEPPAPPPPEPPAPPPPEPAPTYSYPGGLPAPADASARIVGRFVLRFGSEGGIPSAVQAQLLAIARSEAARNGEQHPWDIEAVRTTVHDAVALEGARGGGAEPVYMLAMRGRFACGGCSHPPNVGEIRGRVITLVLYPTTLKNLTFGVLVRYPNLRRAGKVVRLG